MADGLIGRLTGSGAKYSEKQVAETLDLLVKHGVERSASDIHIEPREHFVLVRYRIDGDLRAVHRLPHSALGLVMSHLKTLAGLNPKDTRTPQDGSYIQTINDKKVDIEVSTMPVFSGEKAVLHLSTERGKPLDLERLGFWGDNLALLQEILARPYGLLPVAGPKHSGVSTTLFAMLDSINTPMVNVASVETKVKHRLGGVNQTFTGNTITVAQGLKAALKQDANVVMLSEIPDKATAELAVQAATTGHFIPAGMHASNAVQAVLRLLASDVEPFLLTTALRAAVGQRLVRILCPQCRERFTPTAQEQKELLARLGLTGKEAFKQLHQLERSAAPTIFGDVKQLSSSASGIQHLWRANPSGCDHCDYSGYMGQTAITEVLPVNDTLQKAIMQSDPVSAATLQANMVKNGYVTMAMDGAIKALRGQTTIAEVLRAVQST